MPKAIFWEKEEYFKMSSAEIINQTAERQLAKQHQNNNWQLFLNK